MEADDLNAPLGQRQHKKPSKLPAVAPQVVAALLGLSGLVVLGWAAFVSDPLGGEPMAVVATKTPGASDAAGAGGREHSRYDGPPAAKQPADSPKAAAVPPGAQVITIIDGSSGKRQEVTIPGKAGDPPGGETGERAGVDPKTPIDRNFLEPGRHGAIPKLGPNGARVSALYAQPRTLPSHLKEAPRIAIVIGGLGISASGTADALSLLPAPVTFALAPYGADIARLAERARAENHEVLLQAPMEPFDYPDNDPGPQTLLTSVTAEQNIDRLYWLMSRFQGYVGVVSFMGARFTATEQALTPVLHEISKRGLIFVDGGGSNRSVAGQIAGSQGLPFAKTDIVLDAVATPAEIDRALARLELAARDTGAEVGFATAQPGAVARIAAWAKKVESRGFVLVPISMVTNKTKSS